MAGLRSLYGTEVTTLWEERPKKTIGTLMLTWVGCRGLGKSQSVLRIEEGARSRALGWDPHRELSKGKYSDLENGKPRVKILGLNPGEWWSEWEAENDEEMKGDYIIMEPTLWLKEDFQGIDFSHSFSSVVCFFLSLYNSVVYHWVTSVPLFYSLQDISSPVR